MSQLLAMIDEIQLSRFAMTTYICFIFGEYASIMSEIIPDQKGAECMGSH